MVENRAPRGRVAAPPTRPPWTGGYPHDQGPQDQQPPNTEPRVLGRHAISLSVCLSQRTTHDVERDPQNITTYNPQYNTDTYMVTVFPSALNGVNNVLLLDMELYNVNSC
jgi:hypothetical protein